MNLRAYLFLAGSVLLFVPSQAHANGIWGSPLMLAHRFQLFIGNALIGVLEAYVISRLFGVGILRALVAMVPANYFSTWCVAILFLFGRIGMRGDIFGLTPYGHPWILAGVTYIMFLLASLVLEWPFVMWALRSKAVPMKGTILASAAAQAVSYVLLLPVVIALSTLKIDNVVLATSTAFAKATSAWVYYVSTDDGDVYRIRLDGRDRERVLPLGERWAPDIQLMMCTLEGRSGLETINGFRTFGKIAEAIPGSRFAPEDRFSTSGNAYDLRDKPSTDWNVEYGTDHTKRGIVHRPSGLYANSRRGTSRRVVLEFPGLGLPVNTAIHLPDDQVVFQLGDSIMLLNLPSGELGRITVGRGPLVALE